MATQKYQSYSSQRAEHFVYIERLTSS